MGAQRKARAYDMEDIERLERRTLKREQVKEGEGERNEHIAGVRCSMRTRFANQWSILTIRGNAQ